MNHSGKPWQYQPRKRCRIFLCLALLWMAILVSCSPQQEGKILKIGISEEPRTLNIWLASDANSKKVLSLIYQNLYLNKPGSLELIPWLAESKPIFDPDSLSYTIRLRPAKWADGSELTAEDVAFTVNLIQTFKIPRFISNWSFVKSIEVLDSRTIRFYLDKPNAIFLTRSLSLPIISKTEWGSLADSAAKKEKPLAALMNHKIEYPLGTGPFTLVKRQEGAFLYFEKNPLFFAKGLTINDYLLGPFADAVLLKIYASADVSILALKKGDIDYHWDDIQPGHIEGLAAHKDTDVIISKKSALYFMGFNVRHLPFSDPNLRRAIAILIDKKFLITRILQGFADPMQSIVPHGNQFWCCPDTPSYCDDDTRADRIRIAYELLAKNGFTWDNPPVDADGKIRVPSPIKLPGGHKMKPFTILTPPADYDPHRAASGTIIQEWLKDMGLPASARPMSFGALLETIKGNHDFDTFILGYGKLSLDPDYLRSFFHSKNDKKRGWNMGGYSNPEFDRLADLSLSEMDPAKRQKLIWKMQHIILSDVPYIPLYNPLLIEAINTSRFEGWVQMVEGIGNLWSICTVKPRNP